MQVILSMSMWTSLSSEQRNRIRAVFSIPRSSSVVVNDGVIETDGTTTKDFESLTIEKMQQYLNDESNDFHKLFDKVIAKVTEELLGKKEDIVVVSEGSPITIIVEPKLEPKKVSKKKKDEKKEQK